MANVRCPMCSRSNPPEGEVCAYCGARLKPLQSASDLPGALPADGGDADPSDWLRDLRGSDATSPGSDELGQALPEPSAGSGRQGEDVPDWLARIRSRDRSDDLDASGEPEEVRPVEPGPQNGGQNLPDWLSGLQRSQPEDRISSNVDDWRKNLADFEAPDLRPEDEADQEPVVAQPFEADQPAGQDSSSQGFGITGFLRRIEVEAADQLPARAVDSPIEPEPPEPPDEVPFADWLNQFKEPSSGGEAVNAETQPPANEMDLSAWLAEPAGDPQAAPEKAVSFVDQEDDLPAWLSGSKEDRTDQPTGLSPDRPAWLSLTGAETPGAFDETGAAGQPEGEPSLADPFARSSDDGLLGDSPEQTPDWLAGFDLLGAATDAPPDPAADELPAAEDQPAAMELSAAVELLAAEQPAIQDLPLAEAAPASPEDDDSPDWLRDFQTKAPPANPSVPPLIGIEIAADGEDGDINHPFAVDLPDWLSEDPDPRSAEAAEPPVEVGEEELAQAELPEWVKGMRPIESMIPGEDPAVTVDQRVEKAGPLAGLRGVLPPEDLVAHYRKPPVYSVKLRMTEKQRSQSSLLEGLLAQEIQPLMVPPGRSPAPRMALRALLGLLLLVVLVLPFILTLGPLGIPASQPGEEKNMFDQIDRLLQQDQNRPVLLAVDYEPGLSGEMRIAALPVVEHLMAKNLPIVVISTVPAGPALAQTLLEEAAASQTGGSAYDLATQSVNLGYLPGGTISLLQFGQQPRLAAPVNLAGEPAWQSPVLNAVTGLDGFTQVVVLTDNAETGRAWVEQIQPLLGSTTPLLVVASAQAAPMLMPYIESGQISGMVSGILGGVIYRQQTGQIDIQTEIYWTAYQYGILLAILLVLVGGLYSFGMSLRKRKDKDEA